MSDTKSWRAVLRDDLAASEGPPKTNQDLFNAYWIVTKAYYDQTLTPYDALFSLAGLAAAICIAKGPEALEYFDAKLKGHIEHFYEAKHDQGKDQVLDRKARANAGNRRRNADRPVSLKGRLRRAKRKLERPADDLHPEPKALLDSEPVQSTKPMATRRGNGRPTVRKGGPSPPVRPK